MLARSMGTHTRCKLPVVHILRPLHVHEYIQELAYCQLKERIHKNTGTARTHKVK